MRNGDDPKVIFELTSTIRSHSIGLVVLISDEDFMISVIEKRHRKSIS